MSLIKSCKSLRKNKIGQSLEPCSTQGISSNKKVFPPMNKSMFDFTKSFPNKNVTVLVLVPED